MSKHDKLYDRVIAAIDDLFSDTSVSQDTTIISLNSIAEECGAKIQAIRADMKRDDS
jgi:hypothetical protein